MRLDGRIKQIMENFTSGVSVNCKKISVKYAENIDLNLNLGEEKNQSNKLNRISGFNLMVILVARYLLVFQFVSLRLWHRWAVEGAESCQRHLNR